MKTFLKSLIVGMLLFFISTIANAQMHMWMEGDEVGVALCCTEPDVLQETAQLALEGTPESKAKGNEVWEKALEDGDCWAFPYRVPVTLHELLEIYPGLHPTRYWVRGELWKVEIMVKGSTGDFELTGQFVYVGLYDKPYSEYLHNQKQQLQEIQI